MAVRLVESEGAVAGSRTKYQLEAVSGALPVGREQGGGGGVGAAHRTRRVKRR